MLTHPAAGKRTDIAVGCRAQARVIESEVRDLELLDCPEAVLRRDQPLAIVP
jgi:hypothetical protein